MSATTDELTTPLGMGREERLQTGRIAWRRGALAAAILGVAIPVALVLVAGDPLGGLPHVRVPIETLDAARPKITALPDHATAEEPVRRSAADVETASGVSVVRGAGGVGSPAVIVRVPDAAPPRLGVGIDERLLEPSRYGPLPKIGPDGSRPIDVYARPADELPGGAAPVARIAIVVGGLGVSQSATADAIANLPPQVTLAFAPYGDLGAASSRARAAGHETMLQVPMEPFDYPDSDPGPHTLIASAKATDNIEHLRWAMGRLPGFIGIMTYMGAKMTADAQAITPVLREIGSRGLGFLDDGSSSRSITLSVAGDTRAARADVVLDVVPRAELVDKALAGLEASALSQGSAIATASALPLTVDRIARWAATLERKGILLVPASALLVGPANRKNAAR